MSNCKYKTRIVEIPLQEILERYFNVEIFEKIQVETSTLYRIGCELRSITLTTDSYMLFIDDFTEVLRRCRFHERGEYVREARFPWGSKRLILDCVAKISD